MLRAAGHGEDGEEGAAAVAEAAVGAAADRRVGEGVSAEDRRRVIDAVRYIDANFTAPCTLDALSSIAGMSRFRFARRFRAVIGETPNQYVIGRRLSAAVLRLATTNVPVVEIALEAGFNDLSHFYARFRSAFGCPPGAWRRRQRG